ncbi:MAG TPA: OmpA family protein [Kofleriaceae bacterium]|nr:OmpA family protein [Kofleriaceae bacterium]
MLALAVLAALAAPRPSSADVITIDDGGMPGTTDLPFTCSVDGDRLLWLPTMGFVYRNVEPFSLSPGDTIAFDIQMPGAADLGFRPQVDLALAHASDPDNPFKPDDLPGGDFTVVAHGAVAAGAGNQTVRDYDLAFTIDAPFRFARGGLIIRVSNPQGVLATKTDQDCISVITADRGPTGANRLVGTFRFEPGEYPWNLANEGTGNPGVPYVRIAWTARCGDSIVSTGEQCDDGNTDDTDGCTNRCTIQAVPTCGDGVKQADEECDNSALAQPDPYCDSTCHLNAFAKGSGCSTGGGVGIAAVLVVLALLLRRRAGLAIVLLGLWASSADAQAPRSADGFRVDRFEMAPSVDDGLVVQDPGVLRHMVWSVNAALGYTNTLLRVVPRLSSNDGVEVVGTRLSAYLDFALGLRDRFELHAAVPFALAQSSESGIAAGLMLRSAGTSAVGDARLGGSVLLYGTRAGARGIQLGAGADLAIPVGSENSFTSDGGLGGELVATAAYLGPGYRLVANAGVRYRPEHNYVNSDQGTELIGRAGLFIPVARERLMTSLEFDTAARAAGRDAFRALGSPILAMLGARYHFAGGIRAGAGVGAGLTDSPGSPAVRVIFTVGYSPEPPQRAMAPRINDRDGDGIPDNLDKCPDQPEDYNGYQDEDGCPDILEVDKDRIPDEPPKPGEPLTLEQVVTLPAPIEFKFDSAIMLPGAEVYLNQVLAILQAHSEVTRLEIQGHTSSEGGYDYNMRLSDSRARAVYQWLVDHGIDGQRLVPRGYGLTVPLFPNDTEPHRQRNRRVQFRLIDQAPGSAPINSLPRGNSPAAPGTAAPQPAVPGTPAPSPVTPSPPAATSPATPPRAPDQGR